MSVPSLMFAITPAVLRNDLPRMIGTFLSSSIFITTKSLGTKNFLTFTGTSSTIPRGSQTKASASWIVIHVGFSSTMLIYSKTVYDMRLMLALKSHKAFLMDNFLII
jgi:hypothetical protein